MNENNATSEYMLLFRGTQLDSGFSPQQAQDMVTQWMAWFDRLTQTGKAKAGQPLMREGRVVSGKRRTVADGPFAESKEAIGGYFLLQVQGMDEAVEIAKQCPGLDYGITVEVRPVSERCQLDRRPLEQLATATA
jgi:hypothetical protein